MSALATAPLIQELLLRARAYGLFALWLSENTSDSEAHEAERELSQILARLGLAQEASRLESLGSATDGERLKRFRRGAVSPHETGHDAGAGSAGGITFVLADIAGFYRAFGFEVSGERPDHIVPELEFEALLHAKEAYARASNDKEGADVCADARRKFTAEHLGAWLPQLARRIAEQDEDPALSAIVGGLLTLTAGER